jgi:hypothetical protein
MASLVACMEDMKYCMKNTVRKTCQEDWESNEYIKVILTP